MHDAKLDPQIALYLKAAEELELPPLSSFSHEEVRYNLNEKMLNEKSRPEKVAGVEDIPVPGYRNDIVMRLYTPRGQGPFPILLFVHGGGWVIGNLDTHDSICRLFVNHAGCMVASVDYHLAPESKFPIPLEDCCCALQWVRDHGSEIGAIESRIAVGGDSAGGNIAASMTHIIRDRGMPPVQFQLLIYPALDLSSFDSESHHAYREGYGLTREDSLWFCRHYLNDEQDGKNPKASPLLADDFGRLPPAHIVTAGFDVLRDDGTAYCQKLRDAGVQATLTCYDHLIHGAFNMDGIVDSAGQAIVETAKMLKRGLQQQHADTV
jgi:acetyl esterase